MSDYRLKGATTTTRALPRLMAALGALSLIVLTLIAGLAPTASASAIDQVMCGVNDIGLNTEHQPSKNVFTLDANDYSKISLQDAYGSDLKWTTYNGTRLPHKLDAIYTSDDPKIQEITKNQAMITASDDVHSGIPCLTRSTTTLLANTILSGATLISNTTSVFVQAAVDPSFICQDPKNTAGKTCINLLAIIAGTGDTGDDGGIIGRLYSGLYLGLVAITFACVGIWAAWTGLAKRKLMSALSGIGIAFLIFAAGVIFIANPLLIAEAPMRIGTSLGGCVIMSFNGDNCLNTTTSDPNTEPTGNTECYVDTTKETSITESLALVAKQTSCDIWKAFILEPWTVGQFGVSYSELNTANSPLLNKKASPDGKLDYWKDIKVSLYSRDGSMTSKCSDGNTKYQYSNIAIYQLDLMSDYHACGKQYHQSKLIENGNSGEVYADWAYLADVMSAQNATSNENDPGQSQYYKTWIGSNPWDRIDIAILSLTTTLLGSAVLITTAALAIMYLFIGVLLTTFAPLFFLVGIIPGRGKAIFLGWVEQIVSSILKYFAAVLWMLVTLALYGAVLGQFNNLGGTLIFVIIVTMTMWMYRGEFLKMMGRANYGGTQFSNKIGEYLVAKGARAGEVATNVGQAAAIGFINPPLKDANLTTKQKLDLRTSNAKRIMSRAIQTEMLRSGTVPTSGANSPTDPTPHYDHRMGAISMATQSMSAQANKLDHIGAQAHNKALDQLDAARTQVASGLTVKYGFTPDQVERLSKTNLNQAMNHAKQVHDAALATYRSTMEPLNGVLTARGEAHQAIDELVTTAAANPTIAANSPSFNGYKGDLASDLTNWQAYTNAKAKMARTRPEMPEHKQLQNTMDANKTGYQRMTAWKRDQKTQYDQNMINTWNNDHKDQLASNANSLVALQTQAKRDYATANAAYKRDTAIINQAMTLQKIDRTIAQETANNADLDPLGQTGYRLPKNADLPQALTATRAHADGNAVQQSVALATALGDGDTTSVLTAIKQHGEIVRPSDDKHAVKMTYTDFKPEDLKPTLPLSHGARRAQASSGADLAATAKKLGIRTRTLARLNTQGYTAADVRHNMKAALNAYQHVSKDEAINKWFSNGQATVTAAKPWESGTMKPESGTDSERTL